MQVDQRGPAAGVTHALHQLAEVGARLGDQVVAGVPEVVEVDALEVGSSDRRDPDPVPESGVTEQFAFRAGEEQAVRPGQSVLGQVVLTMAGSIGAGMMTTRRPAAVLGGEKSGAWPLTSVSCRVMRTVAVLVSMSRRRSATSSPQRRPQKQASRTKA